MTKTLMGLAILLSLCLIPLPLPQGTLNVRIIGQVTNEDNHPVVNAWVGLFDGQWNYTGASTQTNQQGKYELLAPALDSYIIDAYPPSRLKNGVYGFSYYGLAKKTWRQDASSITVDLVLHPVGNVVLKAFDENGNLMRQKDFGWQRNVYATDENGIRVDDRFTMIHDILSSANNWDDNLRLPDITIPLNHPRSINLLWDVPSFGKIMVLADNGGKGFSLDRIGDVLIINLNFELARTQFTTVNKTIDDYTEEGYQIPEQAHAEIKRARQFFATASAEEDDGTRAILSNKALNCSLYAGEELEYEKALQSIELDRKKDVTLKIQDETGRPLSATTINYTQTSHDFLFGNWELSKGTLLHLSYYRLMKEAGINFPVLNIVWTDTGEAKRILGLWTDQETNVEGYNVVWFHGTWGIGEATYLYSLTFDHLKEEVDSHVYSVVMAYKDRIRYWALVSEIEGSWSNHWHLSLDQIVEIVDVSCKAARRADPSATIILNFAVPAGESAGYSYGVEGETRGYVPFELLERIVKRNVDFDAIGLQLYYGDIRELSGPGTPARDAFAISRILEWYAQFNKPIFITELEVPSSYSADEDFVSGYWHALPSEETQSDWLRFVYTIGYSKPYVRCITWWDASDIGAFSLHGGVIDQNGRPKLAYYTLKDLIHAWTTEGVGNTDSDGILRFRGFAGNYTIQVEGYESAQVHVSEDGGNEITATLKKQVVRGAMSATTIYVVVAVSVVTAGAILFAWKSAKTQRSKPVNNA